MAEYVIHVGSRSAQGVRPNNEDRYVVDLVNHLFLVADGMGGQDLGEQASGLAAEIIPRVVQDRLAAHEDAGAAVRHGLEALAHIYDSEEFHEGTRAFLARRPPRYRNQPE